MIVSKSGVHEAAVLSQIMQNSFSKDFGECWSVADMPAALSLPHCHARLGHSQTGLAIGFSLFRQVADEAELLLIAVLPAHQNSGFGAQLLLDAMAVCKSLGATRMFLEVRDGNERAAALYQRHGYVPVGRRDKYYRGTNGLFYDAITLKLAL